MRPCAAGLLLPRRCEPETTDRRDQEKHSRILARRASRTRIRNQRRCTPAPASLVSILCTAAFRRANYTVVLFVTSVSAVPNPLPPCCPVAVPLPEEACNAGPADPPPATAVGGAPNVTGADGVEP